MNNKAKKLVIRVVGIIMAVLTVLSAFTGVLCVFAKSPDGTKYITVTKELVAEDINWANGNPIFIYELETPDEATGNNEATNINIKEYKVIEFTQEYVEKNTDATGTVRKSVTFENLPSSQYLLREKDSIRYETTKVYDIENGEAYDYYWTVVNGNYVLVERFEIEYNLNKEGYGTATFDGVKTKWSDASHTDYIVNEFFE